MSFDRIVIIIIIIAISVVLYNLWSNRSENLTTLDKLMKDVDQSNPFADDLTGSAMEKLLKPMSMLQHYWWMETIYMREYMIRAVHQLDSQQILLERLQHNAAKIADEISKIYLPGAVSWRQLFLDNIERFRQVVAAVITFDGPTYDEYSYAWAKNAILIASELNQANPNYSFGALKKLWMAYLEQIEAELRSVLKQKPGLFHFDQTMKITDDITSYITTNRKK